MAEKKSLFVNGGNGGRLTPEVTREVCQRTNSKAMLAGSIADTSGSYAMAYYIACGLLAFAAFIGMASYISVSVSLPQKQIVISFSGKSAKKKEAVVAPALDGGKKEEMVA